MQSGTNDSLAGKTQHLTQSMFYKGEGYLYSHNLNIQRWHICISVTEFRGGVGGPYRKAICQQVHKGRVKGGCRRDPVFHFSCLLMELPMTYDLVVHQEFAMGGGVEGEDEITGKFCFETEGRLGI